MSNKIKEFIRKTLMLIAVIAIIFSGYKLYEIKKDENAAKSVNDDIEEIIKNKKPSQTTKNEDTENELNFLTKETFAELQAINSDFKGYLYYPSLDIYEHVVQTNNNEYYLNADFYNEYSIYGTVFIDTDQSMNQQNKTLYGHWIDNSSLKFSDLHKLKNEKEYDKYKNFYYVDDEYIYEYEVAIVIYHHTIDDFDNIPYWQGDFDENELNAFINNAKELEFYDTGVEFSTDDHIMTLQTCITYDSEERLVVIGREVSREAIKDK